jgi:dolichol-phosphate mannosyltransferase
MPLLKLSPAERRVRQIEKSGLKIAVVVPCYNVAAHLSQVVATIPHFVHHIILINDASRDETGVLANRLSGGRVRSIHLPQNQGVGGAVVVGFETAVELNADIIVKMDGDGQMNPDYLPFLIEPLILGKADFTKGNRFRTAYSLQKMPVVRRFGNSLLSFLAKLASGYWTVFDPTNGYIAIRREVVEMLPAGKVHRRYFFETSLLIALGILGAVVLDIPMPAQYGLEKSNLKISRVLFEFPWKLAAGFLQRLWLRKILYSLTMEAILGISGLFLILGGGVFGVVEFIRYALIRNAPAPAGTVMTAALPLFLGFQMILNAMLLDIQSVPSVPLCGRMDRESVLLTNSEELENKESSGGPR